MILESIANCQDYIRKRDKSINNYDSSIFDSSHQLSEDNDLNANLIENNQSDQLRLSLFEVHEIESNQKIMIDREKNLNEIHM